MSKKITAFGFVLLATLSVLAHAVIPHHHHQVVVCVEDIQHEERACHHDDGIHEHGDNDHQEGFPHATPCEFKLAVVVPSSQAKQLRACDDCSDNHQHDFFLITAEKHSAVLFLLSAVSNDPDYSSFYTSYVTSTLGLRAPPIV